MGAHYTNNDFGWETYYKLVSYGVKIGAVIDTRKSSNFSADCLGFRGAKVMQIYEGSSQVQRMIIGREITKDL